MTRAINFIFFPLSFVLVGHMAAETRRQGNNATCPSPASTLFFFVCLIKNRQESIKKPPRTSSEKADILIYIQICMHLYKQMTLQASQQTTRRTTTTTTKKELFRQFIFTFFFVVARLFVILCKIYTVSFSFPLLRTFLMSVFFFSVLGESFPVQLNTKSKAECFPPPPLYLPC